MEKTFLPRNSNLRKNATELRNHATKEERHLWYDFLRSYPVRFNRQRVIGEYIVDFFCQKAGLIIELDGSQHYEADAIDYDNKRTGYLESLHLKVIRFTNIDVCKNFDGVCLSIDMAVKERMNCIN